MSFSRRSRDLELKTLQISKNAQVSVMGIRIQLIDVTTGNVINEMKLERDVIGFHFGRNLLVFVSQIAEDEHLLSVWSVNHDLNLTHMKDLPIGDYDRYVCHSLEVDEHFIAVRAPNEDTSTTFTFISQQTFQVERSLSFSLSCPVKSFYDGSYLFLMNNDFLVRMLNVASGTFLREIRIEPSSFDNVINIRVNSNYVVIAAAQSKWPWDSKLYVYDLKCLKETDAAPTHLLLNSIELPCKVLAMVMNEIHIVCLSNNRMFVVDLEPIGRLRCPESC
jgi:hypothetical protein